MTLNDRCAACDVARRCNESPEPSCCAWYLENVVVGDASADACPEFKPAESKC